MLRTIRGYCLNFYSSVLIEDFRVYFRNDITFNADLRLEFSGRIVDRKYVLMSFSVLKRLTQLAVVTGIAGETLNTAHTRLVKYLVIYYRF